LALRSGVLYVGRHVLRAHVRLFDLDGHALTGGFSVGDGSTAVAASGIAVDEDRRVWLADPLNGLVRGFNVFGREGLRFGPEDPAAHPEPLRQPDVARTIGRPLAVAAEGTADDLRLVIGSDGDRRHGLQVFGPEGHLIRSLRPRGESHGRFQGVSGVDVGGRWVAACEPRAGRVQVFRDLEHHFSFDVRAAGGRAEPRAVALLPDGGTLVACAGEWNAVLRFDGAGRLVGELAPGGEAAGEVLEPSDLVVEPGREELRTRVAVIDQSGDRLQVFSLSGTYFGSVGGLLEDPLARVSSEEERGDGSP
jgi:hypothetical protein